MGNGHGRKNNTQPAYNQLLGKCSCILTRNKNIKMKTNTNKKNKWQLQSGIQEGYIVAIAACTDDDGDDNDEQDINVEEYICIYVCVVCSCWQMNVTPLLHWPTVTNRAQNSNFMPIIIKTLCITKKPTITAMFCKKKIRKTRGKTKRNLNTKKPTNRSTDQPTK